MLTPTSSPGISENWLDFILIPLAVNRYRPSENHHGDWILLENSGGKSGKIVEKKIAGAELLTVVYARDPEGNIIEIQKSETKGNANDGIIFLKPD